MGFKVDPDYVDVAERIREFKAAYPDGSLQPVDRDNPYVVQSVGNDVLIVYRAAAYRTPDDPRPGIGTASEPYPGRTPYTKGSEIQNAETSAWGRAIVAIGIPTKRVASADEVRSRGAERDEPEVQEAPESNELGDTGYARMLAALVALGISEETVRRELAVIGYTEPQLTPRDAALALFRRLKAEAEAYPDPEPETQDETGTTTTHAMREARKLPQQIYPYGCTLALGESTQRCAAMDAGGELPCESCPQFDAGFVEGDQKARRAEISPSDEHPAGNQPLPEEGPYKKGSVTPEQLARIGAQVNELESLGVGRDEWRLAMADKWGIAHRDQLVKTTTAPQVIDYLARWLTDIKSGVAIPGQRVS